MKKQEQTTKETKDQKLDKLMTISSHKKIKEQLKQFHLTADIKISITYTHKKIGKVNKYNEVDHTRVLKGHDKLSGSRIIDARNLEEAQSFLWMK